MVRDHNCLIVDFKINNWNALENIIDPSDLYINGEQAGFSKRPHCTLLYGFLPEVSHEDVSKVLPTIDEYQFQVIGMDIFKQDDYDVLVYRLSCPLASEVHSNLLKLPNECKYSYKPHLTVGYFQKGSAQKYIETFDVKHLMTLVAYQYRYSYFNGKSVKF